MECVKQKVKQVDYTDYIHYKAMFDYFMAVITIHSVQQCSQSYTLSPYSPHSIQAITIIKQLQPTRV